MVNRILKQLCRETDVQRNGDSAYFETGIVTKDNLRAIRKEERHPISGANSLFSKRGRQASGKAAEVRVGVAIIFENQGSVQGVSRAGIV